MISVVRSIQARDPAGPGFLEVIFAYPGFHVLGFHRLAHFFWRLRLRLLGRFVSHIGRLLTGIEIHPGAKIGRHLFIDHGMGTVIGETAEIGDEVTLYHGVTLGGRGDGKSGKRHPTLGDRVMVGAGAQILGPVSVADDARIGASAVVTRDVPEGCTAVGNPARLANCDAAQAAAYGLPIEEDPDPVGEVLSRVLKELSDVRAQAGIPAQDDADTSPESARGGGI